MNEYKYDDIYVGLEQEFKVDINEDMLDTFCKITGDINPLHNNIEFAKTKGYNERVVYGMLTASFLSTLAGVYLPGKNSLIHEVNILFKKPVFISDSPLTIKGKVIEKNSYSLIQNEKGQIVLKYDIINKNDEKVLRGTMKVGVLDE